MTARKNPTRTKWYLLLLMLTVVVSILYVRSDGTAPTERKTPATANQTTQSFYSEPASNVADEENQSDPENFSFAYCQTLLSDTSSQRYDWGRENYERWDRYLDEGYSLDEVTLAIAHFTNVNLAINFRIAQLRKDTEQVKQNKALEERILREYPELVDYGFTVAMRVPAEHLENFAEKSQQERENALTEHGAAVEDVAYFMKYSDLPDDEILLMLDHVANPSAMISYQWIDTLSLLDTAVRSYRPRIVEALLSLGLRPTSDSYIGSTMDWAINGLGHCCEYREAAARMVTMLMPLAVVAHFDIDNRQRIQSRLPKLSYRFGEDEIVALRQDYGIDLTQIPTRQIPSIERDHRLIRELEAELAEHLSARTRAQNLETDLATCEQVVEAVNQQWQPRVMHDVLNSVVAAYPDAPDRIKRELALIDPSLVDMFRRRFEGRSQRFSPVDMPDEIVDLLQLGKIEEVIEFYSAADLSDANVNSLMWTILGWDAGYYEALIYSGLLREPLEYFDMQTTSMLSVDRIERLENAGAEMRSSDSRQKTLLFYAVERGYMDLVTILEQRGYPFSFDELGEDPLHAALDTVNYRLSIENIEELVTTLMQYRPLIDEFHLSRMAVIQLKYPQTYQRLVNQFPALAVPTGTEFPPVR